MGFTMINDDRAYFQYRAEVETERAVRANDPAAVRAHYTLAEAYFDKLQSMEPQPQQHA